MIKAGAKSEDHNVFCLPTYLIYICLSLKFLLIIIIILLQRNMWQIFYTYFNYWH